jgi:hypothetical protein
MKKVEKVGAAEAVVEEVALMPTSTLQVGR